MNTDRMRHAMLHFLIFPPLSILGNVVGAVVTILWFARFMPADPAAGVSQPPEDRILVFFGVMGLLFAIVGPINARIFVPILGKLGRQLRYMETGDDDSERLESLTEIVGRLMNVPVRLAVTTAAGWICGGLIFAALPYILGSSFPWHPFVAKKICIWTIFVGAPTTVAFIYFFQEWWIRHTIHKFFPEEALRSIPTSTSVKVMPKMLVACLMMGTMPAVLIGHVALRGIQDIAAGGPAAVSFIESAPEAIWFLILFSVAVAIGLSVFLSSSVSEPLRAAQNAMERIRKGDRTASVPVLSNDEIGRMGEEFNRMIGELRELENIRETFGRYLSDEVVAEILKSPGGVKLRGELREISILVADLRGFTTISEELEPTRVLLLLNRFLGAMTEIIIEHEGTIDEITGDGILVFFGAPRILDNHAVRAVQCAFAMQDAMEALNISNEAEGLPMLQMGIAVNCGELIVGNIGSEARKKYGAVGSPINVAFRVEGEAGNGEVLLTPPAHEKAESAVYVTDIRSARLKGVQYPMTLYRVVPARDSAVLNAKSS